MSEREISRRQYLEGAAGTGAALAMAGCIGGGGGGSDAPLEVLHAWTGGDGKKAVENLISVWNEEHGDVESDIKAIGGGANQSLNAVVANRLSNDEPPSSFQGWPGKNLGKYGEALGDISSVWEDGLADAHVEEAAELCQRDGTYHAVPIGSHRLNCLFYNVSVLEEAGVDPSNLTSASNLMDALDKVASNTDKVPMAQAMKNPWTSLQLFGAVLLSTGGFDAYMDFVEGNGAKGAVTDAFDALKTIYQDYISDDASSIGFTSANQKIMNGEAAFIHQGNWAAGAFRNKEDFAYDEDWGFTTFPGTEGMYTFHMDSFIYPSDNPSPEKSETWHEFVGSKDAQIAFNKFKGSIPTRTDIDDSEFGPYLQETIEDFANAEEKPPTLAHGLAVSPDKMSGLKEVLTTQFTGPYNVDKAADEFVSTVQS
jgi:glucose/mannose transport system substrate-binding protein